MSAEEGPGQELEVLPPDRTVAVQDLVELEQRRIERDNRRTDILMKALELAEVQDKRQFLFHTNRLETRTERERNRFAFVRSVTWVILAIGIGVAALLLAMAFFGTEVQRSAASAMVTNGLIGLAGWGIISGLFRLLRSIASRPK